MIVALTPWPFFRVKASTTSPDGVWPNGLRESSAAPAVVASMAAPHRAPYRAPYRAMVFSVMFPVPLVLCSSRLPLFDEGRRDDPLAQQESVGDVAQRTDVHIAGAVGDQPG